MRRLLTLAGGLALLAGPLGAQTPITYENYRLANGLNVFLVEDHDVPVVTVNVWYDVGSRNERPGRSGFAHLFEHMMFQGSANVAKGEHFQLIERAGGNMNGTTSPDRTNYYETLPSNRLNLGLWLEADRMRSLAVTDENLENQRETVKEERRRSYDNQPYQAAFIEGITMPFDSTRCFGYAHTNIGSMADLDAAATADVREFFDLYYAPNNATLTVVGDFDVDSAKDLIEQYFGDIPRAEDPAPFACEIDFNAGAQQRIWEDPLANLPAVVLVYRTPQHDDDDAPALAMLSTILGGGESSRLNLALVRDQQIAVASAAQGDSRRSAGLFFAFAIANQGFTSDTLEMALKAEVDRIIADGIRDDELDKARNEFRANNIFGRQTAMSIAERIQHYVHFHETGEIDVDLDLRRHLAVTAEDIQRVARQYLTEDNVVVITIVPKTETGVQP